MKFLLPFFSESAVSNFATVDSEKIKASKKEAFL